MKQHILICSPDVMGGAPVFADTRVPVQTLLDYLEAGESIDDFLEGFPSVTRAQVVDFLEAAKDRLVESVSWESFSTNASIGVCRGTLPVTTSKPRVKWAGRPSRMESCSLSHPKSGVPAKCSGIADRGCGRKVTVSATSDGSCPDCCPNSIRRSRVQWPLLVDPADAPATLITKWCTIVRPNLEFVSVSNIRAFSTVDKTALVTLFEEMQRHYDVPCPPPDVIEGNLAALPAGVEIVAETDRIIGFAVFSAIYPGPGLQSGLFMEELFVTATSRGSGVGEGPDSGGARAVVERGHKRGDWTADRKDSGLLSFYSGLGALAQDEKIFYRLRGDARALLAASRKSWFWPRHAGRLKSLVNHLVGVTLNWSSD